MSKSTKNIFILFTITLFSIFLGYNLFLNYEFKGLTDDFRIQFNDKNKSQFSYRSSGYNYFEKVYIKHIGYYDHENDVNHRVELLKFEEIDLENKIPRYLKGKFQNTNFNTIFRNSSENEIHFDYKYNSDNNQLDFNIDSEIENIGKMNIQFNVKNIFLSSLTDSFLSSERRVRTINYNKAFKLFRRVDDITINFNNDQFLTSFASFLAFSSPERELEFFEYKFNNQDLFDFKKKLLGKIADWEKQDKEYYENYLKPIRNNLLSERGLTITFNPKALSEYTYDDFWDSFINDRKALLKKIEFKIIS